VLDKQIIAASIFQTRDAIFKAPKTAGIHAQPQVEGNSKRAAEQVILATRQP
jgi:hypothetical protein